MRAAALHIGGSHRLEDGVIACTADWGAADDVLGGSSQALRPSDRSRTDLSAREVQDMPLCCLNLLQKPSRHAAAATGAQQGRGRGAYGPLLNSTHSPRTVDHLLGTAAAATAAAALCISRPAAPSCSLVAMPG